MKILDLFDAVVINGIIFSANENDVSVKKTINNMFRFIKE